MEAIQTYNIDNNPQALVTLTGKRSDIVCIVEDLVYDGKFVLRQISLKSTKEDIQLIQSTFNRYSLIDLHLDIIGWYNVHDSLREILRTIAINKVTLSGKTIPKFSGLNLLFGNKCIYSIEYPWEIPIHGWTDAMILHQLFITSKVTKVNINLTKEMMCLFHKLYGVEFFHGDNRIE